MTTSRLTLTALAAFSSICTLAGASAQAQTEIPRARADVIAEVHAARVAGTLTEHRTVGVDDVTGQSPYEAALKGAN